MKYKIRKTGEIVDVISYSASIERTGIDNVSFIDSKGVEHSREQYNLYWDFEPLESSVPAKDEIDWEQRKYEIAKEVLPAIYLDDGQAERNFANQRHVGFEYKVNSRLANEAIELANALIEELKNNKEK